MLPAEYFWRLVSRFSSFCVINLQVSCVSICQGSDSLLSGGPHCADQYLVQAMRFAECCRCASVPTLSETSCTAALQDLQGMCYVSGAGGVFKVVGLWTLKTEAPHKSHPALCESLLCPLQAQDVCGSSLEGDDSWRR